MPKHIKFFLVIFIFLILFGFIFLKLKHDDFKINSSKIVVTQNNNEIDAILKTRDYRVIDNKEYIQYTLPCSIDEIISDSTLIFQLADILKKENTFFTMLKLNDGNGILAQDQFRGLTLGHLSNEFCIIDKVSYNGFVYKDKIVYHGLNDDVITLYRK